MARIGRSFPVAAHRLPVVLSTGIITTRTTTGVARITKTVAKTQTGVANLTPAVPFSMAHGSYAGNASTQTISLPFVADMVLVKSTTASGNDMSFLSKDMPAGNSLRIRADAGYDTDHITALGTTSFTVGTSTDVNGTGASFVWMALKSNAGGDFKTFTYTGDGTDSLAITGLGFQPDFVTIKSAFAVVGASRFSNNTASSMNYAGGDRADSIKTLDTNGFTLGNGSTSGGNLVNINATAHYGFAFKQITGRMQVFTYTGTGATKTISGLGFTPAFSWIKGNDGNLPNLKFLDDAATGSVPMIGSEITTGVTAFSSGSLTLGADATVNTNFDIYYGMAIANLGATTRTQTGIARVTAITAKTQTALARVTVVTLKTTTAIARITKANPKTQAAISRVTASTPKTQTGIARVTVATLKTITGIARVTVATMRTTTAIARITSSTLKTITALSRITAKTSKTQAGITRVSAGLSVVQSAHYNDTGTSSTTGTAVFSTTPTNGNLLVAFVGYFVSMDTIVPPSGWTLLDSAALSTAASKVFYKVAASETNSYTWTSAGASDHWAIVLIEVIGQNTTTPFNAHVTGTATGATSQAAPSATPTVIGTLALASVSTDTASSGVTIGTGWTVLQEASPPFHSVTVGQRTALTSDTTTAITTTFSGTNSSSAALLTVLINPPSTSRTQTARARITAVTTRTQTGVGRVSTSVAKTVTALARITRATPKAQTGVANLTSSIVTTTRTQTGIARITVAAVRTQTGIARVTTSVSKNLASIARISLSTSRTVTALARITGTTSRTQTGIARITAVTTRAQTALARISISSTRTSTGIARITKSVQRTITAVANINSSVITSTRGQLGLARITGTTTRTQTGVSRVTSITTRAQLGMARITISTAKSITGISRVTAAAVRTQTGIARVVKTNLFTQAALARITLQSARTTPAVARITNIVQKTITGIANIFISGAVVVPTGKVTVLTTSKSAVTVLSTKKK